MTAVQAGPHGSPPDGRYGPGADARADRRLRIAAVVAGVLVAAGVGWYGYDTLSGDKVSGQVVAFEAVSDQALQIHLEVHKGAGTVAVCTVRSVGTDHAEVGRKDVRLAQHSKQVDTVVTVRTTARGETGELVGCSVAPRG
ncbi:DUF4307 domain-containing protein [Actinacidiphila bryophytorum]|uniref:DUF4307 domain-containing protein n=1 Tax=Actinacidiphila bryophytorum TaxID=1436133 RepID=A0A9W4GXH5_9ACTN|nr:DUF4307 domain-containing protein [Actinacidiphila bryophytorum]MBM9436398.1 DUF4307 domain-containing protein [Actinacidiphila bryophytorum]MBN6544904.1 DUF4307 domain-containing protein [Actinacidiphila bryophytorum]CAG7602002.1 conserved hypothetical protein [Actinacidiphila bryophytorum]